MGFKFTRKDKFWMKNPVYQFFKFIYLNVKIIYIVTLGHGGTRDK